MFAEPLHPILVHLPLALGLLLPFLSGAAVLAWWRDWLPGRRLWVAVVFLQALLAASAFAAMRAGESEEERVEQFVAESVLESHEEAAELFVNGAVIVLGLSLVPQLLPRERARRIAALVVVAGTLVVGVFGFQTGKEGGELVYRHGAARAYSGTTPPESMDAPSTDPLEDGEEDEYRVYPDDD